MSGSLAQASDAVSNVTVIIGALTITYYHQYWGVPALSLLIAAYIGWENWKVVQEAINILMFKSSPVSQWRICN